MITRRHTASKETGDVPMTDEFIGALAADPAVAATASGAPAAAAVAAPCCPAAAAAAAAATAAAAAAAVAAATAAAAAASYRIRIDSPTAHFDKILHQSAIYRWSNKNSLK